MHELTVAAPAELSRGLAALPPDAIVRVRTDGALPPALRALGSDAALRALAPPSMSVSWARP